MSSSSFEISKQVNWIRRFIFSYWFLSFLSSGSLGAALIDLALERMSPSTPFSPGTVSLQWSGSPPGLKLSGTPPGGVTLAGPEGRTVDVTA